jgi:hypothetical protein
MFSYTSHWKLRVYAVKHREFYSQLVATPLLKGLLVGYFALMFDVHTEYGVKEEYARL